MTSLTPTEIDAIVVITILAVAVVALLLFLLQRLRRRRAELLHELKDRPDLLQDRAFNRIAMARREADLLARQGVDTGRAQDLIAQAQSAFDLRNFDRAYRDAHLAHETLVRARRTGPLPSASPVPATAPPPAPPANRPAPVPPPPANASGPGLAKNRAEAQFQLRLLDRELEHARGSHPQAGATLEATGLRSQSQTAFDRADFTDSFRLALRGRRALGGSVEALPPTGASRGASAGPMAPASAGARADASQTAEAVAGGDRCPNCGYPALAGDAFCRGCGTPRTPTACPQCGAPRQPADTFCGRCGMSFAPS